MPTASITIAEPSTAAMPRTLEADALDVLPRLRGALSRLLLSVCPSSGKLRPAEISRALGLHQTLAWKLAQIVEQPDPLASVQHVPGDGGVQILIEAARRKGAPAEHVRALLSAMHDFRGLVAAHAGDRRSVQLMLAGLSQHRGYSSDASSLSPPTSSPVDVSIRRSGFMCTSYTWGVQARVCLKTIILNVSDNPSRFDTAAIRGFVGFRRVRPDTPWPVSRRKFIDESGRPPRQLATPIDPEGAASGVPLLREFCSRPPPRIQAVKMPGTEVEYRLEPGPVGDRAAIDCLLGDSVRDAGARWATPDDDWYDNGLQNRTPTELTVIDTFVHESLWPGCAPKVRIVSELGNESWFSPGRPLNDTLPCSEPVRSLGLGLDACVLPEYTRYHDALAYTFNRLRWRPSEFRLFRFRYEYPVLRTAAAVRFVRPGAPEAPRTVG